jgi:hypothetical protein
MPENDELFFERLGEEDAGMEPHAEASSRLKSRIFSALNRKQAESGPLLSLSACREAGGDLCVFEELVRIAAAGGTLEEKNYCRVCHARVLGERVENAPIWWGGCPYVQFQNR